MRPIARSGWAAATAAAAGLLALTLTGAASSSSQPAAHAAAAAPASHAAKPTIVLVHGAWADGSSWAAVTTRLQHQGFTVDVEPNPLRGVASDAQSLRDYLAAISGPIVLVAHSYGGMVTTNAATGNANVKELVYVDAYVPAQGDSVLSLTTAKPGSVLAVADSATVFNTVAVRDATGQVVNADLYVKPALFPSYFAAGVPASEAAVLAAGQRPLQASALSEASPGVPAWKTIPSWDLIGTADRVIPPAEQEVMAARAGAHVVKVKAPHLSMVSDPGAVTALITLAAAHTN
jgi:pimeloyl-ACP methyl ester carboxylesterase